jgi:uncharacterized damage-inducible protein DinB
MQTDKQLRDHVIELLDGRSAHIDVASALDGFPVERMNDRIPGSPHTAWELLEHIRIAQADILDFSTNAGYKEMSWPEDYWPKSEATEDDWHRSAQQVLADLQKMRDLVTEPNSDLFKPIEHGSGQTLLREAMLVADHNAYHIGQLVLLRRIFENS